MPECRYQLLLCEPLLLDDAGADATSGKIDAALLPFLSSARSDALRNEFLKAPVSSYSTEHGICILVASYNLNGALCLLHVALLVSSCRTASCCKHHIQAGLSPQC